MKKKDLLGRFPEDLAKNSKMRKLYNGLDAKIKEKEKYAAYIERKNNFNKLLEEK